MTVHGAVGQLGYGGGLFKLIHLPGAPFRPRTYRPGWEILKDASAGKTCESGLLILGSQKWPKSGYDAGVNPQNAWNLAATGLTQWVECATVRSAGKFVCMAALGEELGPRGMYRF